MEMLPRSLSCDARLQCKYKHALGPFGNPGSLSQVPFKIQGKFCKHIYCNIFTQGLAYFGLRRRHAHLFLKCFASADLLVSK